MEATEYQDIDLRCDVDIDDTTKCSLKKRQKFRKQPPEVLLVLFCQIQMLWNASEAALHRYSYEKVF